MPDERDPGERRGDLIGGRYRIVERLGSGGFGRVWKAHDSTLGVDVAVKEVWLPPALSRSDQDERLARAQREARSAARLRDHPNIVGVHDVVIHDDTPWTVMQLVAGRSLEEQVRLSGPLSPQQAATVAGALLRALTAAHAAGIVHRDVKPANIMLSDDGGVLLADFGIATQQADTALTATGAFIGSVEYVAPERARGTDGLPGSDLFSLGVTLFHAVEGVSPFRRDTPTGTLSALLFEEAPPAIRAGALAPLIAALLEKDPDKRATTTRAFALLDRAMWAHPTPVPETRIVQVPPTVRIDAAPHPAAPALAGVPPRQVLDADSATLSAALPYTELTVVQLSADVAAASVRIRGQVRVLAAIGPLSVLACLSLVLPARGTYYGSDVVAKYIHDDRFHSFPLAIIATLCLAATVTVTVRLPTVRTARPRLAGYICGLAALVYWLYRLVSLQDLGEYAWSPFSSRDHLGAGMWLMVLVTVALTAVYTRQERTSRQALNVRLLPLGVGRVSQRSYVAAAVGVAALIVAGILLPSRQRYGFAVTAYGFLQGYHWAYTVPHQLLWIALAFTVLSLAALCVLPRIKSPLLRIVPYPLACLSALCWSYQLVRLHDYNIRYRGDDSLGLGAWLMVLATFAVPALYGWREATTRAASGTGFSRGSRRLRSGASS